MGGAELVAGGWEQRRAKRGCKTRRRQPVGAEGDQASACGDAWAGGGVTQCSNRTLRDGAAAVRRCPIWVGGGRAESYIQQLMTAAQGLPKTQVPWTRSGGLRKLVE